MSELSGTGLGPKHRRLTQLAGVYYDYSIVNYFVQLPPSLGSLAEGANGVRTARVLWLSYSRHGQGIGDVARSIPRPSKSLNRDLK